MISALLSFSACSDNDPAPVPVAVSSCTGLTTTAFTLPSISDWVDPAIGAEPVVSGPPKVIGGVIQTS